MTLNYKQDYCAYFRYIRSRLCFRTEDSLLKPLLQMVRHFVQRWLASRDMILIPSFMKISAWVENFSDGEINSDTILWLILFLTKYDIKYIYIRNSSIFRNDRWTSIASFCCHTFIKAQGEQVPPAKGGGLKSWHTDACSLSRGITDGRWITLLHFDHDSWPCTRY